MGSVWMWCQHSDRRILSLRLAFSLLQTASSTTTTNQESQTAFQGRHSSGHQGKANQYVHGLKVTGKNAEA